MNKITRRRLTNRQVAVLAALERRGDATTVPQLHGDFPQLKPATSPCSVVSSGASGTTSESLPHG